MALRPMGCLLPKCHFGPVKRFAPIMTLRCNLELGDHHPDYRLERNPAGCDMEPVEVDVAASDGVDLRLQC